MFASGARATNEEEEEEEEEERQERRGQDEGKQTSERYRHGKYWSNESNVLSGIASTIGMEYI